MTEEELLASVKASHPSPYWKIHPKWKPNAPSEVRCVGVAVWCCEIDGVMRFGAAAAERGGRGHVIAATAPVSSEMRCETPQEALAVLAMQTKNIAEGHERRAREARKLEKYVTAREATNG